MSEKGVRSPKIAHLAWGRMEVEGLPPGRDFKPWPGGGREWDWGETNTHHVPGIQPADVEELLLLALTNGNPAAEPFRELFDDATLIQSIDYPLLIARLEALLDSGPPLAPGELPLVSMLRPPMPASPTSPSSVAEKSMVCRSRGTRRTILSTWGLKPMSSIRSASSRIKTRMRSSETRRRSTRSCRRPGVVTRMCAPSIRLAWLAIGAPP